MKTCPWKPIDAFKDYAEFERFCHWMNELIAEKEAEEVSVQTRYQGIESFTEKWYRHIQSGTVWRLVYPDPPFTGLFEMVAENPSC